MNSNLKAIIVHISDTHFNKTFQNVKPTFLSRFGAAPHGFKPLCALDTAFHDIPYQLKRDLNLDKKPKINMVIVTGDITTDGDSNSFGNAQTFLKARYMITKNRGIGLNMKNNLFLVPGNHDCLFQMFKKIPALKYLWTKYHSNYHKQFIKLPYFRRRRINNMNFLLIGIDTNREKKRPRNIARGKVGTEQLQKIDKYLTELRTRDEEFYNNSFKIAFFHHHLVTKSNDNHSILRDIFNLLFKHNLIPHDLRDRRKLIDILNKHKIDMAIFGHEHKSYKEFCFGTKGNIIASCAGSASQLDKKHRNSFNLYLIFPDKLRIVNYRINKESKAFECGKKLPPHISLPITP